MDRTHSPWCQVLDEAKDIMSNHPVDVARKKLRVGHYVAMLEDFGVPSSEYSEERGGKTVRLKAKALVVFFWSRRDLVTRYHTFEEPAEDSEDSSGSTDSFYTEEDDDDYNSFDSDEWVPDSLVDRARCSKRKRE